MNMPGTIPILKGARKSNHRDRLGGVPPIRGGGRAGAALGNFRFFEKPIDIGLLCRFLAAVCFFC